MKTIGTTFLRFKDKADAQAYVAETNAHSLSFAKEPFAADWYPRQDVDGFWCAPFYGPPYVGASGKIEEPADFDKLRIGAEEVDALYWPDE